MLDTPQCVQWIRSSMCSVRAYFSVSLKITILYVFNPHYGCHEHVVCQDIAYPYMYSTLINKLFDNNAYWEKNNDTLHY